MVSSLLPHRVRHLHFRPRRRRSRILLGVASLLGLVAVFRGFGPYYLNLSLPECAGDRIVICTNHRTYRPLEHMQFTVFNHTTAAIMVAVEYEPDTYTGNVILTTEWQNSAGEWLVGFGVGPAEPSCGEPGGANIPYAPPPQCLPRRDMEALPPGGWITSDDITNFPAEHGSFRMALLYAPTGEALWAADLVVGNLLDRQLDVASLPASVAIALSAPFDIVDNGDRLPSLPHTPRS